VLADFERHLPPVSIDAAIRAVDFFFFPCFSSSLSFFLFHFGFILFLIEPMF